MLVMRLLALHDQGLVEPVLLGEAVQQLHLLLWRHVLPSVPPVSRPDLGRARSSRPLCVTWGMCHACLHQILFFAGSLSGWQAARLLTGAALFSGWQPPVAHSWTV